MCRGGSSILRTAQRRPAGVNFPASEDPGAAWRAWACLRTGRDAGPALFQRRSLDWRGDVAERVGGWAATCPSRRWSRGPDRRLHARRGADPGAGEAVIAERGDDADRVIDPIVGARCCGAAASSRSRPRLRASCGRALSCLASKARLKFQDVIALRGEAVRTVASRLMDEDGRWTDVLTMRCPRAG